MQIISCKRKIEISDNGVDYDCLSTLINIYTKKKRIKICQDYEFRFRDFSHVKYIIFLTIRFCKKCVKINY